MNNQINAEDFNQAIDNKSISFENRLTYDKLSFYYISLPIMLLGNILGAFLLSAMQINVVDSYSIGIWLLVSFIMFLYQLYHYYQFKNEPEENKLKNADIWLDKYYTNILLSGIVWGSAAFLVFPESNLMNQMIVMLFLFAIGFSAMGVLASKQDLLLTYVLAAYSPLILRLFFMEDDLYTKIAYAVLALILIMILIANYYGKIINNSLNNRQHFISIKHSHEKLKERFFSLFERAPVGIYYYDKDLKLQDVNTHFIQMNKKSTKKSLLHLDVHDIQNKRIILAHKKVFKGDTGHYRGPFEILKNDIGVYVNLSCVPMFDTDGKVAGGITIINDITNEITAKEKMIRYAYYDILTNIPNRTLLMDKLKSFLIDNNQKEYAALLVFDIDNFKKVNETYGHDVGDNLLKQVVIRIEKIISTAETFSRISGNKFVIFIPKLNKEEKQSQENIKQYIDTINKQFILPLNLAGEEYHLSFTIGAVLFNDDSASAYDLLKRSETAMYRAKGAGKGTSLFYQSSMSADIKEELMLENDIHKAIKNHEFEIHYQPQLDFKENKITGAEALVRWNHPTKGSIPPATFIPIAEESGIIIKLEEWIFDKVLSEIKTISLLKKGFTLNHIAINVSTIHFLQPLFVENLMLLVSKHKVKPEWIELEITENGVMENLKEAIQKVHELKSFGFTVSLDDFGTGYSSLAYLKELPVDTIKIDQSFVFSMNENTGDAIIVESVVAIGKKFNFKILAEGVENQETLMQLKSINCDSYQGFLAHKPMPLHQLKKLL
ncbi:MAG TPA: EAL domain-containing protein [Sulfurovum sp.]|nr:EAL domain-containing protein [Sulfurovum sp.]